MGKYVVSPACPDCGTVLDGGLSVAGLCAHCLLELALAESPVPRDAADDPEVAPTLEYSGEGLAAGRILGNRYQIRSLLGRGGMGGVWRAYDLKLRVDVALKALHLHLVDEQRALETLRQEVRTAREVVSPNVCRVFDLVELDGQELVSMEYIDGTTLKEILTQRSPLELDEARETAAQFLAGLEAIHAAGLVHRDMKPENVMLTRSGRAVVMDFGIAKGLAEAGTGTIAGTPAYMAPEQARGDAVDTRTDVYSAAVVLAEMIAPDGVRDSEARQAVWRSVQRQPPELASSPWQSVIRKAVSWQPEDRYSGAAALARALEEVTLRVAGAEDVRPYPGLASFTENDAEYFFGRELEVEAMWKKLRRPHLLGLIGPSGAGKSSFIRAGLLPVLPTGWRAVITTPGSRPLSGLARALADEVSGDPDAVRDLLRFDEPEVAVGLVSGWRKRHEQALVIVDQFEELFTQNPPEAQEEFSELLARLALEADVHVLLSMRDDFLGFCSQQESLAPVFSELTALKPLSGGAVRRALVQPAARCGYRFEDDTLVDEMVAEVSDERGALPMLAFAAARLWEHRDREQGLLTREAYEHIGGVAGALARHAEKTLEQIGTDRTPIVRELFRNLVTAEGTRAARERNELLSVFTAGGKEVDGRRPTADGRAAAEEVLDTLIDARLLTSFEVAVDGDAAAHRIEIIHESLLSAWPRLVRWQTQDTEGAQLRDDLRQAAQMWEQHSRSDDLLWTGTAFREFQLWRERYPGGLTGLEKSFGKAMVRHAERRRRRRSMAIAVVIVLLLVVLSVVTWSRFEAVAEARRAEASKLLVLAEQRSEEDPTEALAYATASLGLSDTKETRLFALRLLLGAPSVIELDPGGTGNRMPRFSPDGHRLAVAGHSEEVRVFVAEGGRPEILPGHVVSPRGPNRATWASNELLVTGHFTETKRRIWSLPGGRLVREIDTGAGSAWWQVGSEQLLAEVSTDSSGIDEGSLDLRSWKVPDGETEDLGRVNLAALGGSWSTFHSGGPGWVYGRGNEILYRSLPAIEGIPDGLVGRHDNEAQLVLSPGTGDWLWTRDAVTSELRQWDLARLTGEPLRVVERPTGLEEGAPFQPDPSTKWGIETLWVGDARQARLWDLNAWREARPLALRRSGSWYGATATFQHSGDWFVASTHVMSRITFWPLKRTWPSVVEGYKGFFRPLAFSPDGAWLATWWPDRKLRLWPLPGRGSREVKMIEIDEEAAAVAPWTNLVFDPQGRFLFMVGNADWAYVVPLDGSPPRRLESFSDETLLFAAAVSPSGRQVATAFGYGRGEKTLRVWSLDTGELRLFDLPQSASSAESGFERGVRDLFFADEVTLYSAGDGGVRLWDLETGNHELVFPTRDERSAVMAVSTDGRTALVQDVVPGGPIEDGPPTILDLSTGASRALSQYLASPYCDAFVDPTGSIIATGDGSGFIRVGRVPEGEPHLLPGHEGMVDFVAISPGGQWIASTAEDNTLRLWPMPDLDEPPLHTLPLEELLAKLKSLTNIRVVRDPESPDGWKVTLDPFPGWAEVPTW